MNLKIRRWERQEFEDQTMGETGIWRSEGGRDRKLKIRK